MTHRPAGLPLNLARQGVRRAEGQLTAKAPVSEPTDKQPCTEGSRGQAKVEEPHPFTVKYPRAAAIIVGGILLPALAARSA